MPSLAELIRSAPAPRAHGGLLEAELEALRIDPADVLDVSSSVNPYGPAPDVLRAVRAAAVERYPDPDCTLARRAVAASAGTDPGRVVLGNGATELLWTLARVLLARGETVLCCEPSFSELRAAATLGGARVVEWRARADDGFALDLDAIARAARAERASVVSLCVPGNPSGAATPIDALLDLAHGLAGVALVLDQSFLALSDRHRDLAVALPDNVLAVRSLTKEHAIPGVRVGYVLCAPALAAHVAASRPAWTVGSAAQAAAVASGGAGAFVAASRTRLRAERLELASRLHALGLATVPSSAPYLLVATRDAADLRRRMLARHRVLVRDCTSFGLPGFVRLAVRGGADLERLVAALAAEEGAR
jgi:histidinol-phosphate/aromatic aminotransferase/cobyric acid decarboxylase-like protein